MSEVLRVGIWQHAADLDPSANRASLAGLDVPAGTDLLVLPEAAARDFGVPGSALGPYAEPLDGPWVGAVRSVADRSGAAVLAGMFEQSADPARPFNTLVLAGAGTLTSYRKIHLYDSFGQRESDLVTPGPITPVVAEVAGFQVGLMTCYDLRFPELARALSAAGAEVLVLPAAWASGPGKVDQWQALLRARAIENLCWVVAAAQPGPRYCGHSMVITPTGEIVAEAGADEAWLSAELDLGAVRIARERNSSLGNRRM
ncbi:MAG: Nitrilase/cyanide hydratase and apolipoprotein N-acyltransferase [Marmoricola sp.]|nr:Nitrilase/cyanide hydratase and apolipoprotein N-acyltransferase [Marmoricola sp.]